MPMSSLVQDVLYGESAKAHSAHMNSAKHNVASANNIVRHSVARSVDEPSPGNAAASRKILALPRT